MNAGRSNRRRGADAERAVVAYLRENGWPDARRYLAGDGRQPGDIDAIPGVALEVKDHARPCWPAWCRQAIDEAGPDRLWVVVRRVRGVPYPAMWPCVLPREWWLASCRVEDLPAHVLKLRGDFGDYIATAAVVADTEYVVTRFWRLLDTLKEAADV